MTDPHWAIYWVTAFGAVVVFLGLASGVQDEMERRGGACFAAPLWKRLRWRCSRRRA